VPTEPKEHDYLSFNEAARTARPRLATSKGIATTGADRAIVTALAKEAASVLEWPAVDADLQHATVKPVFQSIIIPESQNRLCLRIDRDGR
jgi:hypothetical protein